MVIFLLLIFTPLANTPLYVRIIIKEDFFIQEMLLYNLSCTL